MEIKYIDKNQIYKFRGSLKTSKEPLLVKIFFVKIFLSMQSLHL